MSARSTVDRHQTRPVPLHRVGGFADSAVEGLVEQIKGLIDARNLSVGDRLPSERELGAMFSSSRTTVREAMRILKAYGVVDVRPKVGAVIIDRRMDAVFDLYSFNTLELSRETFLDTQGFRQLIEVGSVDRLLERIGRSDIDELRRINDMMRAETTLAAAALQDYRFHTRLVTILGNQQILEIYRLMMPVMLKIMENSARRGRTGSVNYDEHAAIVAALEDRNRIAYQYRVSQHLEAGIGLFKE